MANVEIYTKETCPYCHRAKALLSSKGVSFQELPDRKSTRLNSSHSAKSRMPSSA